MTIANLISFAIDSHLSFWERIMCSYEHFKSGVFISHPGNEGNSGTQKTRRGRRRVATRVVKSDTQKKLGNVYLHLDKK
jgi:hypothetical protein